jgi:c-di-GMP-related signal transduction protein
MQTAVSQAEPDVREIENLVKGGASSCYRLLRYLNSAAFGFANEIDSLRHALAILGERKVRRWIWLVATLDWTRQDHRPGLPAMWSAPAFVNWSRRKSRTAIPTCS